MSIDLMQKYSEELCRQKMIHQKGLAQAFMEATGVPATMLELVQQIENNRLICYIRQAPETRSEEQALAESQASLTPGTLYRQFHADDPMVVNSAN